MRGVPLLRRGGYRARQGRSARYYEVMLPSRYTNIADAKRKELPALEPDYVMNDYNLMLHHYRTNMNRVPTEWVQNTKNVTALPRGVHQNISAYYSSKQDVTGGPTVREWASKQ